MIKGRCSEQFVKHRAPLGRCESTKVDGGVVKMAKTLALQARGWSSILHVPTIARSEVQRATEITVPHMLGSSSRSRKLGSQPRDTGSNPVPSTRLVLASIIRALGAPALRAE